GLSNALALGNIQILCDDPEVRLHVKGDWADRDIAPGWHELGEGRYVLTAEKNGKIFFQKDFRVSQSGGESIAVPAALRPADALSAVELMPLARPNSKVGTWKREGATLVSVPRTASDKAKFRSVLPIPTALPREFIVEAVIERLAGDDVFTLNIPAFDTD